MAPKEPTILITEEAIQARVTELARRISTDYSHVEDLLLVGILRGCFIFLADLSRRLTIPRRIDSIALASYGHTTTATGAVRLIRGHVSGVALHRHRGAGKRLRWEDAGSGSAGRRMEGQ